VNLNPAFGPKKLDTAMGLIIEGLYGIPFTDILKRLIVHALTEGNSTPNGNGHIPAIATN